MADSLRYVRVNGKRMGFVREEYIAFIKNFPELGQRTDRKMNRTGIHLVHANEGIYMVTQKMKPVNTPWCMGGSPISLWRVGGNDVAYYL
ncbi:hypothetical protein [Paenibacillus glacialis]|uniref:hypothetical protein n=1 Tax=Paenibacillus glacialis TaxID=494026 RepID=UPI001B8037E2|nr:hypothetical protein [Paenibacillus glacialis]